MSDETQGQSFGPEDAGQNTTRLPRGTTGPATGSGHEPTQPIRFPLSSTHQPPQQPTQPIPGRPRFDDYGATSGSGYLADLRLPGSEPEPLLSRPPLLVWVVTGLFVSLMAMCTFLYPAFTGPDEKQHVDLVYSFYNGNLFYKPGERHIAVGVQNADQLRALPPGTPLGQRQVIPRGQRRSFDALGGDAAGSEPAPNPMVQHPPLYYALTAGILRAIPGSSGWPYDRWVALLRYFSILMVAPLPILAWATVKTLVGDGPAAVTASVLPLSVPNLARLGGSANNDNLLILLAGCLMLVLAKVIAGDLRRRTGLLAGLFAGLACLTKGFGLVPVVAVGAAYVVAWLRQRRPPWAALCWAAALTAAVGAWWWVRNLVLYGTIQPDGYGSYAATYYGARRGFSTTGFLDRLVWRTWGGIGYPERPFFSTTACWVWAGILIAGVLLGLGLGFRGRCGRLAAAVFILPAVLAVVILFYDTHRNDSLTGVQGRFLYFSLIGLFAVTAVGLTRVVGQVLAAWVPLVVLLGALATQVQAWRALVRVWWVPASAGNATSEQVKQAFRAILRWSPWGHPATTGPFVAAMAFGILVLIAGIGYGWLHRRGEDEPLVTDDGSLADPAFRFR